MIDWDAPASTRLTVQLAEAALVVHDRLRPEPPLQELDAGADGPAAEALLALTRERLGTMTVREFCTEYGIDASRLEDESGPGKARRAYLALGSNLGDRAATLQRAVDALAAAPGVAFVAVSPVYETSPVGGPEQDDYLNAVVEIETALAGHDLLALAQRLEGEALRVRAERWGPRTLDVDVLLVGDETIDTADLVVPHPRMFERAFVMVPLADLDPTHRDRLPPERAGVRLTDVVLQRPE